MATLTAHPEFESNAVEALRFLENLANVVCVCLFVCVCVCVFICACAPNFLSPRLADACARGRTDLRLRTSLRVARF